MVLRHDFKRFPELTNRQMQLYYFDSPHKQIGEDFLAKVVKVTDGDTIRVLWTEREFDFPIRIANLAAPEIDEEGGRDSQSFLEKEILGKEVEIVLTKTRVEKWGRLLAYVINKGMNMNELQINNGHAVSWNERKLEVGF
jgi:endonuclease YncB( thermonuclease family)